MRRRTGKIQSNSLWELSCVFLCRNCDREFDRFTSRSFPYCDCSSYYSNLQVSLLRRLFLPSWVLINRLPLSRRRRAQSLKYLKTDDDHRQHLNASTASPEYPHCSPKKPIQIEHPHLLSSTIHHRPHSANSMTTNETLSDRESLLKQTHSGNVRNSTSENFYDEIKDPSSTYVQQTNLALGKTHPDTNLYLEPKSFEDRRKFFDENKSTQPIRDHREVFYYECER